MELPISTPIITLHPRMFDHWHIGEFDHMKVGNTIRDNRDTSLTIEVHGI